MENIYFSIFAQVNIPTASVNILKEATAPNVAAMAQTVIVTANVCYS